VTPQKAVKGFIFACEVIYRINYLYIETYRFFGRIYVLLFMFVK